MDCKQHLFYEDNQFHPLIAKKNCLSACNESHYQILYEDYVLVVNWLAC
jgi:hypothetical protein